ncbi:hypothetical protein JCM21714_3696 [Gracilibacillus boraciitolerans JCM 21714]|uniref:Uncharacterized protein n=1 Tax=Gracilibacillus boraciitolerans JCM 21714 TaxID=1298598 RepID=W4VP61_9BACI|nr:hypothetical protein [Gracilibacillus boraciitolerans]GAE94534.1 hypothetical protein JCM21714_3696 [Gracilibacillus boraciitolerans JCM 21714]
MEVKMKKIYLLFTDTGTMLSRMINLCTKSTLNHASIAFDTSMIEVYSFGRKQAYNPWSGGFVKEDLRSPFFSHAKCAIYQLSITENTYQLLWHRIKKMEVETDLYRYNLLGLFGVLFNMEWNRQHAFFCSEFVVTVLKEAGLYSNDKPACLIKPQDLKEWHALQLIYHGDLSIYLQQHGGYEVQIPLWKRIYS